MTDAGLPAGISTAARLEVPESGPRPQRLRLVQFSDPAEINMLVPLGEMAHKETRYGHLPFSERKFRQRPLSIPKHPEPAVGFYVVLSDRIVGAIDLGVGEPFLAEGGIVASCRSLYVSSEIRSSLMGGKAAAILLSRAKQWARAKGAEEFMVYDRQGFVTRLMKGGEADGANVAVKP